MAWRNGWKRSGGFVGDGRCHPVGRRLCRGSPLGQLRLMALGFGLFACLLVGSPRAESQVQECIPGDSLCAGGWVCNNGSCSGNAVQLGSLCAICSEQTLPVVSWCGGGPGVPCSSGSCQVTAIGAGNTLVCRYGTGVADAGCTAGSYCLSNVCNGATGCQGLSNGDGCQADNWCNSGYCMDGGPTNGPICANAGDAGATGCTSDPKSCQAPLICDSASTCCIPQSDPLHECAADPQCCPTVDGGAVSCNRGTCCNSVGGACYNDLDCCSGNICSNSLCAIADEQGECYAGSQCISQLCDAGRTCACYADGTSLGSNNWWECCSSITSRFYNSFLHFYYWVCEPNATFDAGCSTSYQLSNTLICDPTAGKVWKIAEGGSAYEPCLGANQCGNCVASGQNLAIACQVGAGTQNTGQCCNSFDAGCYSDQDCCPFSACNAVPNSGVEGSCEATSTGGCSYGGTQCVFYPLYGAAACQKSLGVTCGPSDTGCRCQ